jgi:glycosyltransferase involved in cell wall biosynthesis
VTTTPSRERVCLVTGGGYPYRRDALSGWCRTLVEGLRRFRFELLTVLDRDPPATPAYPLPLNVSSARVAVPATESERLRRDDRDEAKAVAARLAGGLVSDQEQEFGQGLRDLAGRPNLVGTIPLADALSDAWRSAANERLSMRDARTAAGLLRHALAALTVQAPEAGLLHCVGGTTPLLTALAARWRTGTPLLLTEARTPVARHKPAEDRLSASVRMVLRRFRAGVTRTGYGEADLIAPLSTYHHDWAQKHGAAAARMVSVPPGVDPSEYPHAAEINSDPALVWAGSGGPDSGLTGLLAAFEQVAAAVPGAVLHLVGVTAAHEEHCAHQIERTGLGRAVRMHPLPAEPGDRYNVGHVVAHVPGPSDPPYRLIEAMMSGRPVVGVDVGPAAETLGDSGVVVHPDDPAELAIAIVNLLRSPGRRRALGDAARRRALTYFTNDRVVRVYGALYRDLMAPPPVAAFELALAVAAPRSEPPATLRWLVREDA